MTTTETRTDTAAIYCRLSRSADTGKVMTLGEQEKLLRAEAKVRGLGEAGSYVDDGISAFKRVARPGFDALTDAIRAGQVQTVLTVALDRTARRMSDLARLVELAEDVGGFTLIAGGKTFDLPDDATMLYMLGAGGEEESRTKSKRVLRSKAVSLERGLYNGGRRPHGYMKQPGAARGYWIQEPDEADAIRTGAAMILEGQSLAAVARDWNRRGIPRSLSAAPWTAAKVKRTLASPIVAGLRSSGGQIVGPLMRPDGSDWPRILTPEQRDQITAVLAGRYGRRPARWHSSNPALLSGLVRCGQCGSVLTIRRYPSQPRASAYSCQADGGARCGGVGITAPRLDELVTEAVLQRLDSPAMRRALKRPKRKRTGEDPAVIQAELDALATAAGSGQITIREMLAARPLLGARLTKALEVLADDDTTAVVSPALADPRAYWEAARDLDRRRTLLGAVIECVTIAPATGHGWNPDRVAVTWLA